MKQLPLARRTELVLIAQVSAENANGINVGSISPPISIVEPWRLARRVKASCPILVEVILTLNLSTEVDGHCLKMFFVKRLSPLSKLPLCLS